ncbi:MAG: S-layer homology domain-containing protein, partial [Clostridia bacterium]|nr:S-layer homology domain-containing protein [Clostridia bacterium]
MKKVLALLLTLALLLSAIPAVFAEEYEVSKAVLGTEIPQGYTRHTTIKVNQGFYKKVGVTPWLYQRADIDSDQYQTLTYINTGWFDGMVNNWVMGATASPGSMHPGTAGDIVVTFVAPRDGKYMIEATEVTGRDKTTDGTRLKVLKGTTQLFPDDGWATVELGGKVSVPAMVVDLKKDETLHFRVNCIGRQEDDTTYWTQEISLLNDGSIPADEVIIEEKKPMEIKLEGLSDKVFATSLPEGYQRQTSYIMEEAFSKAVGETPWLFQRADIDTNNYETLEFIQNGWFHGEYANWAMGANAYPGSLHPGTQGDAVITFVAPFDGKILIEATTCNNRVDTADGSNIRIYLNDEPLYPTDKWLRLESDTTVTLPAMALEVKKGDEIHFRVNCHENQISDTNYWKQTIAYIKEAEEATVASGVTSPLPEGTNIALEAGPWDDFKKQNKPGWSFQNVAVGTNDYADLELFEDKGWFTGSYQNWRPGSVYSAGNLHPGEAGDGVLTYTAPKDGTLVLPASKVTHRSEAGDGVKIQVLKNNTALFPAGGMMEVRPAETVNIPEMMFSVKAGDQIHFRVNCNANQSADATAWTPTVGYADGSTAEEKVVFADLEGHWAESAVMNLYEQGLVQGKGPNTYDPEASVTRAEFLTLALRAMGGKSAAYKEYYSDVDINAWFANTVVEAFERDLIADELTPDGKFNPDTPILREEMTSVLINALQSLDYFGLDKTTLNFTDAASCAP